MVVAGFDAVRSDGYGCIVGTQPEMDDMIRSEASELVIGLVAPAGVDLDGPQEAISRLFSEAGYIVNPIRMSRLIENLTGLDVELRSAPHMDRMVSYMDGGNRARERAGSGDVLARLAMVEISATRGPEPKPARRIHLIRSFKHPAEVVELRRVYGNGLFLVGIHASRSARLNHLVNSRGLLKAQAESIIARDESEGLELGQRVRDVFHLADAFISMDRDDPEVQIARIVNALLGDPHMTPTRDEHAMFLAYSAALRSGDLSRQVGAVVANGGGDILATGANDVPCYGGGLYWGDDLEPQRDADRGVDSNQQERNRMVVEIMKSMTAGGLSEEELLDQGLERLQTTGVLDITEYGRAVHAEMAALLSCARTGASTSGATLYCTTFPCHNCAKHIIAAGISRVVYVEPYAKSKAYLLHSDALCLEAQTTDNKKVMFEPFIGVGPRHFMDLFSLQGGNTAPKSRKDKRTGVTIPFDRKQASLRVCLPPISYLELEQLATLDLPSSTGGENDAG